MHATRIKHLGQALIACVTLATTAVVADEDSGILDVPLRTIDGEETTLSAYEGKAMLIVNVASKCGLTPQYEGLEAIHRKFSEQGFTVLAFPCNQFGRQEPGTPAQIVEFCQTNYDVTFPLFEKIEVNGKERHPLYEKLAGEDSPFPGNIKWNFGKFLVSPDGAIVSRFEPGVKPESKEVVSAIEGLLAQNGASSDEAAQE